MKEMETSRGYFHDDMMLFEEETKFVGGYNHLKEDRKRLNEMGRLSTIHQNGVSARDEMRNKANGIRSTRWTEEVVLRSLRDLVDDFACDMFQQIEAFCKEVNEDASIKIYPYKLNANDHMSKKGYLFTVGFTNDENLEGGGSFDAVFGIGWPKYLRASDNSKALDILVEEGKIENIQQIADYLSAHMGQKVLACYESNRRGASSSRFFFEFENYEPMARAHIWDDILDTNNRNFVIGSITGKGQYSVASAEEPNSMVVPTDKYFECLEKDTVFADWLVNGSYDPMYDEETGEYLESKKYSGHRVKESLTGNGGWPYDEDDIVWSNDDEVLVSLMPNAYPEDIQDEIMGSGAFDELPKEVEDEIAAIEGNFQEACKAYGGYEFVFDGDGESGMIEPEETGFICMKYGDFILMCDEYGFDPNTINVSMKSEWY